jgi:Lantibiotic dehydratase, N terminus
MSLSEPLFGHSALLRIAGCPIQFWLATSNPALFERLRQLSNMEERYRRLSARLADRLGSSLIPHTTLSRDDRRLALKLRRQFHNDRLVLPTTCLQLVGAVNKLKEEGTRLAYALKQVGQHVDKLCALRAEVDQVLTEERGRLPRVAWELLCASPMTRRMLLARDCQTYRAMERLVRSGSAWSGKPLRKTAEQFWLMIDRAATKSTPRDWHGHVACLWAHDRAAALSSIALSAEVATEWIENIHIRHSGFAQRGGAEDLETCLVLPALHWAENDHLQFWSVDPSDATRMVEIRLRRTSLLDAIYSGLRAGPKKIKELRLVDRAVLQEKEDILLPFIKHLIGLGVLQIATPLSRKLDPWHHVVANKLAQSESVNKDDCLVAIPVVNAASISFRGPAAEHDRGEGYVDVYRRTATECLPKKIAQLQRPVQQVLRVLSLIEDDATVAPNVRFIEADEKPKPILELLRRRVDVQETARVRGSQTIGWPPARNNESAYSRLLGWIATKIGDMSSIDIKKSTLDGLQAPEVKTNWPVDCILRPCGRESGWAAVVDKIIAAGIIDARFVETLTRLHGPIPHVEAYHHFLRSLEEMIDITLIPPLSRYGANAVRRPIYTSACTGDADIHTYCPSDTPLPVYIPLDAITLRRTERGLVAEADGRPICPMYHATRSPMPPWDLLCEMLLSAARLPMRWRQRSLHHAFKAFHDRQYIPRITVDGALVLSCAQWRLSLRELWDPSISDLAKARALDQLRRDRQLPRWVFVSSNLRSKPTPCDLESVRAIRVLERIAQATETEVILAEMLPTPDELLVADRAYGPGNKLVSEIVLRFPVDESPTEMAARLAPQFSQAFK